MESSAFSLINSDRKIHPNHYKSSPMLNCCIQTVVFIFFFVASANDLVAIASENFELNSFTTSPWSKFRGENLIVLDDYSYTHTLQYYFWVGFFEPPMGSPKRTILSQISKMRPKWCSDDSSRFLGIPTLEKSLIWPLFLNLCYGFLKLIFQLVVGFFERSVVVNNDFLSTRYTNFTHFSKIN